MTTADFAATPAAAPVVPAPREPRAPHEHELHLVSVDFEGGLATREYLCAGCGATWFD